MKIQSYLLFTFLFSIVVDACVAQSGITTHALPTGYPYTQLRIKNCIATDALNNVYIGFRNIGIGKYTPSTQAWVMYDTTNTGLSSNEVTAIKFDALGNMWAGTSNGISMFDGINWIVYDSLNSGLLSNKIKTLTITSAGVWCGTNRGVNFFDGVSWTSFTSANSGLVNDTVLSIDAYNSNDIYIGTQGGLSHYTGIAWINYTTSNSVLSDNKMGQVKCVSSNVVWLVSRSNLYQLIGSNIIDEHCQYDTPSEFSYFNQTVGLTADSNNKIYFLKGPSILARLDTLGNVESLNDSLWSSLISSPFGTFLVFDNSGTMWCTGGPFSNSGYLFSFDENASAGFTSFDKNQFSWQRYLDINSVSTLISNKGSMFWNMDAGASGESRYEAPKCSGKTSTFTSGLWIGGFDQFGQLHVSAQTYNQSGTLDFNSGPLDTTNATTTPAVNAAFNNIWKIDRNTIDDFKTNFLNGNVSNGTYPVAYELLSYPAIGFGNHTRNMSPFVDYNNDGNYNPYDGDYPLIKGDQQLYWIFNDVETANRESGMPLGLEIRAYAFAYNCDQFVLGDSNAVLNYTTFYRYEITNRSNYIYDSVFIGIFNDFDLGDAADDYIGCDTVLNAGFCYNSTNYDGNPNGYGFNPPMFNCQLLKGPEPLPNDSIDNDHDGVTDEAGELNMMTSFNTYIGDFANNGNPETDLHYYHYLTSRFKNGMHLMYGFDGMSGTIPTDYLFSGVPYSGTGWTEPSMANPGADKRGIICSGPFHFSPGETKSIDFAYVFTWDSTAANGLNTSIARNTADLQRVKYWFDNNNYPSCLNTSFQNIDVKNTDVTIYPNPADEFLNIIYTGNATARIEIYDITGRYITAKEIKSRDKINILSLSQGLYVAKVLIGDDIVSKKFIRK